MELTLITHLAQRFLPLELRSIDFIQTILFDHPMIKILPSFIDMLYKGIYCYIKEFLNSQEYQCSDLHDGRNILVTLCYFIMENHHRKVTTLMLAEEILPNHLYDLFKMLQVQLVKITTSILSHDLNENSKFEIIYNHDSGSDLWKLKELPIMKIIPFHNQFLDSFMKEVNENLPQLEDQSLILQIISENRKVQELWHWHSTKLLNVSYTICQIFLKFL